MLFLTALLAFSAPSIPAQSAEPNVSIRVVDSTGVQVSDGLVSVRDNFSNKQVAVVGGHASLLLPDGKHNVSVVASPPSVNGNVSIQYFNFEIQVSGQVSVDVRLPEIVEFAFNVGTPRNGFVNFGLNSYFRDNTEGFYLRGSTQTQSIAKITVGQTKIDSRSYGSTLTSKIETTLGSSLASDNPFGGNFGLRVVDGVIRFKTFAPQPLSGHSELQSNPRLQANYDIDSDGYWDYTYGHKLGANAAKGVNVTYKQLMSGVVPAALEGITDIKVEPFADTISSSQFVVRGRVIASSPAYIPVSSPVTMLAWQRMRWGGSRDFVPYQATLGQATLDSDGNFTLKVSLSVRLMTNEYVSPYFRISSPGGITTMDLQLPEVVKKYKNCNLMSMDFVGGVAKFETFTNKGKKTKFTPFVSPKVYALNKALDTDRDNLVCER